MLAIHASYMSHESSCMSHDTNYRATVCCYLQSRYSCSPRDYRTRLVGIALLIPTTVVACYSARYSPATVARHAATGTGFRFKPGRAQLEAFTKLPLVKQSEHPHIHGWLAGWRGVSKSTRTTVARQTACQIMITDHVRQSMLCYVMHVHMPMYASQKENGNKGRGMNKRKCYPPAQQTNQPCVHPCMMHPSCLPLCWRLLPGTCTPTCYLLA